MRFWRSRDSERRKLRRTLPVADSNSNKLPLPPHHRDCDHRQMHGVHQPVEILMMLHLVLSIVQEPVAVGPTPEQIDQIPTIDFLLDLMRLRAQNHPVEPILLQRLLLDDMFHPTDVHNSNRREKQAVFSFGIRNREH
jgi:hypothetical protein